MAQATKQLVREHKGLEIPAPGVYELDTAHTTIEFVARHLMITKVRGRFTGFSGEFTVAEAPEQSSAQVTIDAATVDPSEGRRDAHLRSPDFFDVENFPEISFRSTGVEPGRDGRFNLLGDLTVRGVTRPVVLDV